VGAQAAAMQAAASNEAAGPAMAFMGMNMAANAGGATAQNLFAMGQQPQQTQPYTPMQSPVSAPPGWACACGHSANTGKFCAECGKPQPEERSNGWKCECGAVNKGKFCSDCGKPQPAAILKCSKCGWEPDGTAPKFCPECGNAF